MRKKSLIGWAADGSAIYDPDTGKPIKGRREKNETLRDFEFCLSGTIGSGRVVLHLPLIAQKKSFWNNANYKSVKVKVTIEEVESAAAIREKKKKDLFFV